MSINTTVANLGDYTETFNVTVYANAIPIKNMTITNLPQTTATSITFLWTTTGLPLGNYTISAYAWPVPGEINVANNRLSGGWVIVAIPGDITGLNGWPDGKVNMLDVGLVASAFGSFPGSLRWNPNCDITGSTFGVPKGRVNMLDVGFVASQFGHHA
jgi:hypothetical protein